jgi:hypothetical protein
LHDLTGAVGVGEVEVAGRLAAAEGLVRPDVLEDVVPDGNVGEVDDHVRPLGETHEEAVLVVRREIHRGGEEPAFVADLPHLDAGDTAEVEDQEARLAAVEEAEPVATLLDLEERPRVAVDHDHVAEELGVPDRRDVAVRDIRTGDPVEELAAVRVKERAIDVERAVLDRDRDLSVRLVGRELVPLARRRAGKHCRLAGSAV